MKKKKKNDSQPRKFENFCREKPHVIDSKAKLNRRSGGIESDRPERREASRGKRRLAREWRAQTTWSTCLASLMAEITSPTLSRTCASASLFLFAPSSICSLCLLRTTSSSSVCKFCFCFPAPEEIVPGTELCTSSALNAKIISVFLNLFNSYILDRSIK